MLKPSLIGVLIGTVALASCAKTGPVDPPPPVQPVSYEPVEATADAIAINTALQVCEVDSLRAQRDERIESARALLVTGFASGGDVNEQTSESSGTMTVTQPPYGEQTERTELVRAFEIDLDAAYRFAEGACRAYAACMHQQDYEERACMATLQSWERAQDLFTEGSLSLAEIRAHIARPARHGNRNQTQNRPSRRERECDGVIAGLFTTDACRR